MSSNSNAALRPVRPNSDITKRTLKNDTGRGHRYHCRYILLRFALSGISDRDKKFQSGTKDGECQVCILQEVFIITLLYFVNAAFANRYLIFTNRFIFLTQPHFVLFGINKDSGFMPFARIYLVSIAQLCQPKTYENKNQTCDNIFRIISLIIFAMGG